MLVLPTVVSASSSSLSPTQPDLLPTPIVSDSHGAGEHGTGGHDLRTVDNGAEIVTLFPTPLVDDAHNVTRDTGSFQSLTRAVGDLLPTPTQALADGGQTSRGGARSGERLLSGIAEEMLLPTPVTDPVSGNGHARDLGGEVNLLPTPSVQNSHGNGQNGRGEDLLPGAVEKLLPTPSASQFNDSESAEDWEARRQRVALTAKNGNGMGTPLPIAVQEIEFLPTPVAAEGLKAGTQNSATKGQTGQTGQVWLSNIVQDIEESPEQLAFLGTPTARDWKDGPEQDNVDENGLLGRQVWQIPTSVHWGKYEPAIRRTEAVTGLRAPDPTKPDGKGEKRRLSSVFVEWMMMLIPGTVTRGGLTRTQELSRLGNGVVPLQAGVAVSLLISRLAAERRR